jgi:hypothetical protein
VAIMTEEREMVWVFQGAGATHAAAVFKTKEGAIAWIEAKRLTGTLTAYPLDQSAYDWAVESGHFLPKNDEQRSARFIQRFSSAHQPHLHFEDGSP